MEKKFPELVFILADMLSLLTGVIGVGLGGSWGRGNPSNGSDLDLFLLVDDEARQSLNTDIPDALHNNLEVCVHVYVGFVAESGFLHQIILKENTLIDIVLIPENRLEGCKPQPAINPLVDPQGRFEEFLKNFVSYGIVTERRRQELIAHYEGMFYVTMTELLAGVQKKDIWLSLYYLERLRNIVMSGYRVAVECYSPLLRKPEKRFIEDIESSQDITLLSEYRCEPSFEVIRSSAHLLYKFYSKFGKRIDSIDLKINDALRES